MARGCWNYVWSILVGCAVLLDITKASCYNDNSFDGNCQHVGLNPVVSGNDSLSKLQRRLFEDYDSSRRPGITEGKPTIVTVDMWIGNVDAISTENMDYTIGIFLRQRWIDPRLTYSASPANNSEDYVTLDAKLLPKLWVPDMFFSNEKRGNHHCVTRPNKLIRIKPDGTVLYSARYSLVLGCSMDLRYFPMDKQECPLQIESYGYSTDELQFKWKELFTLETSQDLNHQDVQFDLTYYKVTNCTMKYRDTGSFTCLQAVFSLTRRYGYYITYIYVPSALIVALSWISFWISKDAIPARISLGAMTVLTMTTQCIAVWTTLPRVSYIKSIDIWMSACILFVFGALLEFALVNTVNRRDNKQRAMMKSNGGPLSPNKKGPVTDRKSVFHMTCRFDKLSRFVFPFGFGTFNVIYWCVTFIDR